jgi:hypothetical protein
MLASSDFGAEKVAAAWRLCWVTLVRDGGCA